MSRFSAASVARAVDMMRNLWIGCCQGFGLRLAGGAGTGEAPGSGR
jgi:hypothetical protein